MTRTISLAAAFAGLLLSSAALADPAPTTTPTSTSQCQSKWVAAGNNGAKADRYVQPKCQ